MLLEALVNAFRAWASDEGWPAEERTIQHGHQFRLRDGAEPVVVNFYTTGKALIQGNPSALKEAIAAWWQEHDLSGAASQPDAAGLPEITGLARIGLDESGKGDYFGPLVIGAAYVDAANEARLIDLGVRDSKRLVDAQILPLARSVQALCPYAVVAIEPARYNALYAQFRNLNRLLAWGHARALENVLEHVSCSLAIADQFGNEARLREALLEKGKQIRLEQRPRAEADTAVAAASILARAEFVRRLRQLSARAGVALPKGASDPAILAVGRKIAARGGREALAKFAKLHFKTTKAILGQ